MAHVPVVSDKMRYGLKPIAVESKAHVLTLPCIGAASYDGDTSSTIVFRIQHNPSGRYVDPQATKFKVTFSLTLPVGIKRSDAFFFERGPESMIKRFQIKDVQGRILEDIDNYNLVYAVTEICTNEISTRQARDQFSMEGNDTWSDLGGWIRHPNQGFQNVFGPADAPQVITFDVSFTPFSAVFGGACDKYIPLSVMEGMEIWLYLENPQNVIKYQFIGFPVGRDGLTAATENAKAVSADHYFTSHKRRTAPDASQKGMNLFRAVANAATNSVMWSNRKPTVVAVDGSCTYSDRDNSAGGLGANYSIQQDEGIYQWELTDTYRNQIKYTVSNPKILLSCLDVEPAVNNSLVEAAKDRSDKMIRIQTFSWTTYTTQILSSISTGSYSWTIPVSVTSMKSIFFTLTDMANPNNANYLKSGFEHRGLKQYRILIGGLPLNADWVTVQNDAHTTHTYSEAIGALMEAWSVHHKSDGNPSLITPQSYRPGMWNADTGMYQREYNAVFGQELESFSQKSGLIQSGLNTMQTTFVLELIFGGNTVQTTINGAASEEAVLYNSNHNYQLTAYVMYDKVIAFDENSGSIRAEY